MDAKVFTYILLVFALLKLHKTSAQSCTITLSAESVLTVYDCRMGRMDLLPVTQEQGFAREPVSSSRFYLAEIFGIKRDRIEDGDKTREDSNYRIQRSVQANKFGTKDWPAEALCKSAPGELESGTYYLGPTGKPMAVYCNMATRDTCIRTSKTTPEFNHDPSKGAFWLHEENVRLTDLYTDISVEQLTWLRDRSESVRQTLKYNCLDSVPHSKYNVSSSVKLWAWNDIVIKPYPTDEFPLFYSIPEATDKCVEGSTEWKSTIIELQSSNVHRLPIVDIWIGDIRNEKQKPTKVAFTLNSQTEHVVVSTELEHDLPKIGLVFPITRNAPNHQSPCIVSAS